ncbi:MAG: hypothetical protein IT541_15640 [Hyphomicrobiales bacterium]|nr:hypothetical protein [Hyphomicrobiales bacterium]
MKTSFNWAVYMVSPSIRSTLAWLLIFLLVPGQTFAQAPPPTRQPQRPAQAQPATDILTMLERLLSGKLSDAEKQQLLRSLKNNPAVADIIATLEKASAGQSRPGQYGRSLPLHNAVVAQFQALIKLRTMFMTDAPAHIGIAKADGCGGYASPDVWMSKTPPPVYEILNAVTRFANLYQKCANIPDSPALQEVIAFSIGQGLRGGLAAPNTLEFPTVPPSDPSKSITITLAVATGNALMGIDPVSTWVIPREAVIGGMISDPVWAKLGYDLSTEQARTAAADRVITALRQSVGTASPLPVRQDQLGVGYKFATRSPIRGVKSEIALAEPLWILENRSTRPKLISLSKDQCPLDPQQMSVASPAELKELVDQHPICRVPVTEMACQKLQGVETAALFLIPAAPAIEWATVTLLALSGLIAVNASQQIKVSAKEIAAAQETCEDQSRTFYRGVSAEEAAQITLTGTLQTVAGAGEVKYLTNTYEGASLWGLKLNGPSYQIAVIIVPERDAKQFTYLGHIDNIGQAWTATPSQLVNAKVRMLPKVTP